MKKTDWTKTDWANITHLKIEGDNPLGNDCWLTADGMAHYDLKSAEERRDKIVASFALREERDPDYKS